MKIRILACLMLALAAVAAAAQTPDLQVNPNTGETKEQFVERTLWWRDAKFGMFIHWGVYAVPADATDRQGNKRIAEWFFSNKQMQVKDYEKFAGQFNPVKFDARRWVKTAKDAGMKYIVITSKHHDGFCMFDSALTDYCITKATPFKRDPMKELAAECRRQGIRLCFYHSIMDWHHPDYVPRRPWEKETRPAAGADLNHYIDYMKGQLRELLTHYGPIGVIWFDGGWEHNAQELRSEEVNRMIRSLQPGILINDRNHLPEDHSTPEQTIPAGALPGGRLWETCMTMNDTWGYARNDQNWKSTGDLVRKLCDIASKGGNFLLNVGPTELGEFPEAINERLAQIGAWMEVNGRSIYGTTKSPLRRLPSDLRCTRKGNTLYLQVFRWPEGELALPGLQTRVRSARALAGGETLAVSQGEAKGGAAAGIRISRPRRLDPYATVIELRLDGPPVVEETAALLGPGADGAFTLRAADADIHGATAQYEQGGGKDNIGFWTNAKDYVTWSCDVRRPGRYGVDVDYACPPENAGSRFTVGPEGGATVVGTVKATGSWTAFKSERLGEIELPAGKPVLAVRVTEMPRGAVMNLRRVRLVPLGGPGN
jgi:alpha-L-fucosidase